MYPSLIFSDFHLPCFLKSLSLTPIFAAAVAPSARRLWNPNNLVSSPIFLSPSITFSLTHVLLICFWQLLSSECDFVVIIPLKIYIWQLSLMLPFLKYWLTNLMEHKTVSSFLKINPTSKTSVLLFSINIVRKVLFLISQPLTFITSLNRGKPIKDETQIKIVLKFERLIVLVPK